MSTTAGQAAFFLIILFGVIGAWVWMGRMARDHSERLERMTPAERREHDLETMW